MPHTRVIAVLINPDNPGSGPEFGDVEVAARALGLQVRKVSATNESELNAAFVAIAAPRVVPYVVLDARYEKVRIDSVIQSQAVLIAVGIDWEGRRQVLGVEIANRESRSSWRDFLMGLKERGLHGVEFVVSDDHDGLKKAIAECLSGAAWQRCYVHFLRNAIEHLPRKRDDDCLQELRWLYDRRQLKEAKADIKAWIEKWQGRYAKLVSWVEDNIEETLT